MLVCCGGIAGYISNRMGGPGHEWFVGGKVHRGMGRNGVEWARGRVKGSRRHSKAVGGTGSGTVRCRRLCGESDDGGDILYQDSAPNENRGGYADHPVGYMSGNSFLHRQKGSIPSHPVSQPHQS